MEMNKLDRLRALAARHPSPSGELVRQAMNILAREGDEASRWVALGKLLKDAGDIQIAGIESLTTSEPPVAKPRREPKTDPITGETQTARSSLPF